jgi:hypothetical protein
MNYHYQFGIPQAATPGTTWPLEPVPPRPDFSHGGRSTLAEGTLDEPDGGGPPPPGEDRRILRYHCAARPPIRVGPGVGPIDWNCDSLLTNPVSEDLNASGSATDLLGDRDDWGNLDFKFQCQPTFADGAPPPERVAREELTLSEATALRLRAGDLLCDAGHEDCDGIASNGCETPILGHGSCPPSP